MFVAAEKSLSIGWITTKLIPPEVAGTFFIKGTYKLVHGSQAVLVDDPDPPQGDVPALENEQSSIIYENDFAPFKPKADVLVTGHCYAPGGKPTTITQCTIRIGPVNKSVLVFGDRVWKRGLLSSSPGEPVPFTKIRLIYENAFGGSGWEYNPVGRGLNSDVMPNIEERNAPLSSRSGRPSPAGFGPLHRSWRPRSDKSGTFDKKWLRNRWPWFPEDFNFESFNAAPLDQRITGYLIGDETVHIENMHPIHPVFTCKLPSLRARCFLKERRGTDRLFREVNLRLDTLWIDMDCEKLVLVWRGHVPVLSLKLKELLAVYGLTEPLSEAPRDPDFYRLALDLRMAPEPERQDDSAALKAEEEKRAAENAAFFKEMEASNQDFAKYEAEANASFAQIAPTPANIQQHAMVAGIDPKLLEGKLIAPHPSSDNPATFLKQIKEELIAANKNAEAALKEYSPKFPSSKPQLQTPQLSLPDTKDAEDELAEDEADAEAEAEASQPWTRERVLAAVAEGRALRGEFLAGLDLSGADLSGGKFEEAILSRVKLIGAKLVNANLKGASLRMADLSGCDLTGALLERTDFSKSKLGKAKLAKSKVTDAAFWKCEGEGADFSGAEGEGARFSRSNLRGANFRRCKLVAGDFDYATLEECRFEDSELPNASFETVKAARACFDRCNLAGARFGEGSQLQEGGFLEIRAKRANFPDSVLDRAVFAGAELDGAIFSGTSLREANLARCSLVKADFSDAKLQLAIVSESNLLRASLERCDLTGADLRGSNCHEAEFWDAITTGAKFETAILSATKLEQ